MGHKVNPVGLRLGVNRTWDSRWYADKGEYGDLLQEDFRIRDYLLTALKQAAVSKVVIERPHKKCRVTVHSGRPGVIIGKKAPISKSCARHLASSRRRMCTSTSSKCANRKSTPTWLPLRSPSSLSAVLRSAAR